MFYFWFGDLVPENVIHLTEDLEVRKCWLAQANHVMEKSCLQANEYSIIVETSLTFSIWPDIDEFTLCGTFITETDIPMDDIYLFLPPVNIDVSGSHTALLSPPEGHGAYHWAFDPQGLQRLPEDTWEQLGLPRVHFHASLDAVQWGRTDYDLIGSFHSAKGFEPNSQDVAIELGYPLVDVDWLNNLINGGRGSAYITHLYAGGIRSVSPHQAHNPCPANRRQHVGGIHSSAVIVMRTSTQYIPTRDDDHFSTRAANSPERTHATHASRDAPVDRVLRVPGSSYSLYGAAEDVRFNIDDRLLASDLPRRAQEKRARRTSPCASAPTPVTSTHPARPLSCFRGTPAFLRLLLYLSTNEHPTGVCLSLLHAL
ncbi:hypothetical protein C8J57DRAFT_1530782 [Mycena rebaudengoi]|nr:hypothetical protein C8J57DRAFT_1530782 [Mycena rebaudengoi]